MKSLYDPEIKFFGMFFKSMYYATFNFVGHAFACTKLKHSV